MQTELLSTELTAQGGILVCLLMLLQDLNLQLAKAAETLAYLIGRKVRKRAEQKVPEIAFFRPGFLLKKLL